VHRELYRNVWVLRLLFFFFIAMGGGCLGGATASAAESHIFDPELSLTGGCSTSPLDSVPDPGCPELPHKPGSFLGPAGVTTDFYGNVFISSEIKGTDDGRVDIFDRDGKFLSQIVVPTGAGSLAVDSGGNLYVSAGDGKVKLYKPTGLYQPENGVLEYGAAPSVTVTAFNSSALAINFSNDHLLVHYGGYVVEFSSAEEGNGQLAEIGKGVIKENFDQLGLAVDAAHGRIYVSESGPATPGNVRVFELDSPHKLLPVQIDGSDVPGGELNVFFSLAVDEGTGNLFLYSGAKAVFEFDGDGKYLRSIEHGFEYDADQKIAVDNGPHSENGALNPNGRYLFVPSHPSGVGHVFAFGPAPKECPPEVLLSSFVDVSETEASLQAVINPCGLSTGYTFEYTTEESFEKEEFDAATAFEGQLPSGATGVSVESSAADLLPDTRYRFRVIAVNSEGSAEGSGRFATYPATKPESCPNDSLRVELSATLPDCRAYELVTPVDTNARIPIGLGFFGAYFPTRVASPDGSRVSFLTEGGSIPGTEGTGSLGGDPYLASRRQTGWQTASAGPTGEEAPILLSGGVSLDQRYSFWGVDPFIEGNVTVGNYVRYPDGQSELIGRGSIGTDPAAGGKFISENGGHVVFVSEAQVEESAPPAGTRAIYDRTADEVTHVVSLLPGDASPTAGQSASYLGASLDGEGIAFSISNTLYLRHDNEATYEIGNGVVFAGIAKGGERIFYMEKGKLLAFDIEEGVVEFNSSGTVTPVNVSPDGSAAYFVSPEVLSGEANPNGEVASVGGQNLYLSREGAIDFVGIVTDRDVEGEIIPKGSLRIQGLGLWTEAVSSGRLPVDPSRVTPDGNVMIFESRAPLTDYDSEGHTQLYRFDSVGDSLVCISCNPTLAPAGSDVSLQSIARGKDSPEPFGAFVMVANLRADGRRAFFQSEEALVPDDNDGLQDVYEWEDEGIGSCERAGGCVYLISSGHSDRIDYLYAVSDSGNDVFFRTADLLLGLDGDRTPSIYDARVGGGFPEPEKEVCAGEGCKSGLSPSPDLPTPGMLPGSRPANATPPRGCPKGKHKVKKGGRTRCVKKGRNKHRKAGSNRKGGHK
jgi:hypothetical protein